MDESVPLTQEAFAEQAAAAAALQTPELAPPAALAPEFPIPGELVTTAPAPVVPQTLEQQQAAQLAAEAAQTLTPPLGTGVAVPPEFGEQWQGKSLADVMGALRSAQQRITELTTPTAPAAPAVPAPLFQGVPGAAPTVPGMPPVGIPGLPPAQAAPAAPTPVPPVAPGQPPAPAASPEQQAQQLTDVLTYYSQQFETNGTLTAEQVGDITTRTGVPGPMVGQWIQGQAAQAKLSALEVHAITDGEQGYTNMLDWMGRHQPNEAIAAFNQALDSNDLPSIKYAVQAMFSQYKAAGGGTPTLLPGRAQPGPGADPFGSWEAVTEAMTAALPDGRTRYEVDPAYRQEVDRRVELSQI